MFSEETYGRGLPERGNHNVSRQNAHTRRRLANQTRLASVCACVQRIFAFSNAYIRILHFIFDQLLVERQSELLVT